MFQLYDVAFLEKFEVRKVTDGIRTNIFLHREMFKEMFIKAAESRSIWLAAETVVSVELFHKLAYLY